MTAKSRRQKNLMTHHAVSQLLKKHGWGMQPKGQDLLFVTKLDGALFASLATIEIEPPLLLRDETPLYILKVTEQGTQLLWQRKVYNKGSHAK